MMREEGLVLSVDGEHAIVSGWRKKACGSCQAQATCGALSGGLGNREVHIRARNTCQAEVGDRVILEISERHFLSASFWAYIFPLLVMLLVGGVVTDQLESMGQSADQANLMGAVTGLLAMAGSFLLLHRLSGRFFQKEEHLPEVVEVISLPFTCAPPA